MGSSSRISELMRYFEKENQYRDQLPEWDLTRVLLAISGSPYEPVELASRLDWSVKTAFLLALASAKRRGEIHALAADGVFFDESGNSMTLAYEISFLPKSQPSGSLPEPFQVASLMDLPGSDVSLCPVRAVRHYFNMTAGHRGDRKKLFIPVVGNGEVSKATISRWIALAVRRAYQGLSKQKLASLKINAHEVRAVSTSWAFFNHLPLTNILNAACWKSHSTFTRFYLRSMKFRAKIYTSWDRWLQQVKLFSISMGFFHD